MIQLTITETGKSYAKNSRWERMSERNISFPSTTEAKKFLRETYGKCKRNKMYVDKNGKAMHCGYIYGFHNADLSHLPVVKWIQQDWVCFSEVEEIALSPAV